MTTEGLGPRISPVAEPTQEQQELLQKTGFSRDGRPLNIFGTLAHHPLLLKRANALGGAFMAHGRLPARPREIVILRVAAGTGCAYEFAQHTLLGSRAGLTEDEIGALAAQPKVVEWARDELTLIGFVDELLRSDDVSETTWRALSERWTAEDLIELVLMVGFYRMLAGFLQTLRVELEPDLPAPPPAVSRSRGSI